MEGESGQYFCAAKAAVAAFSKSLAKTVGPSVRVNCLAPGWIQTAWGQSASPEWDRRARGESLLGRWGARATSPTPPSCSQVPIANSSTAKRLRSMVDGNRSCRNETRPGWHAQVFDGRGITRTPPRPSRTQGAPPDRISTLRVEILRCESFHAFLRPKSGCENIPSFFPLRRSDQTDEGISRYPTLRNP